MKKSLIFVGMLVVGFANAQETNGKVGVNTETPKATLEVQPTASNLTGTTNEGLLIPRLSKERVAKMANPETSTLVYVNEATTYTTGTDTAADTRVAKIDAVGFYHYNGTQWVKHLDTDTNDAEWIRDSNSGVDKIYMKNVLTNDEISYRRDKGYYGINLGGIEATDIGFPLYESPNYTFINSSKLPSTAQNNKYYFNKNISLLKNEHLVANSGREYTGNLFRLETKGVTSTQEYASAIDAQLYHTGAGKIKFPIGLSVSNTIDGTKEASAGGNVYGLVANARTVGNATADKLVGIWGYVNNMIPTAGKSKLTQMIGVASEVNSSHPGNTGSYASAELGSLFGYKTDVTNNTNSKTDNMKGLQTILTFQNNSELIRRAAGVDAYALFERGAKINEYSGIVSNMDNVNGAVTITSLHGIRLYNNIHADSQIENMYGIRIEDVDKGKINNYAILTNKGKVRIGDLIGTGDRVVYADENGVLKVGNAYAANTTNSLWTRDEATNTIKLAVNSDGTDRTNAVTIDNAGAVYASSLKGYNGATIFPDYVFQKYYDGVSDIKADYTFKSLSQVEDFVKTNGHLPGYKSAEAIKAQGYVDLMETQLTNVEKIEELYLHSIEQEKKLKQLNEALIKKNQELEARLEKLEKLLK